MMNPLPIAVLTEVNREFECPTTLSETAQKLINIRLLEDDEGVWARCDKCKMWRYAPEEKDPGQLVNRNFHCQDVKKVCNVGADDESDQRFYETRFCAGSLVWAKRPDGPNEKDWPWWPAIVEDALDEVSQYFLLDAKTDTLIAYHITYLDAHRAGGWIRADLIKPFKRISKNDNKQSKSLLGEKRRLLDEAAERASNAAKLEVVQRLEKYSYIAHLARLRGVLEGSSLPADAVLNNKDKSPSFSRGSSNKNMARRSKPFTVKRKRGSEDAKGLSQSEATTPNKTKKLKTRRSEEAANKGLNAIEENPRVLVEKAAFIANVKEAPTNTENIDVDSGYLEDSVPEGALPVGEQRTTAKVKKNTKTKPTKKRMDSDLESRELSSLTEEEARSAVQPDLVESKRQQQKPKKSLKPKEKKTFSDSGVESSVVRNAKNRKLIEELPAAPISSEAFKTPRKKDTKTSVEAATPASANSFDVSDFFQEHYDVSGSVPRTPKADKALIDQKSEGQRQKTPTGPKGSQSSVIKRDSVKTAIKPLALPKPSNKNQVRARSGSVEGSAKKGNKRHDATPISFTQPIRKQSLNSATNRRDPLHQNASQSFHKSQPTPSQDRRKFAPPTREKTEELSYSLDEFQRDLEMGVI